MDRSIGAGILGIVLATIINISIIISPPLDWLPTFIIVIIVIFVYRLGTVKDGLIAAFMTYIFSQAIIDTLVIADYYTSNRTYTLTITAYLLPDPIITAISALIAAYTGVWLARKRTPPPLKTQPQQSDIPPDLQTV